jgi:hypothetical protein
MGALVFLVVFVGGWIVLARYWWRTSRHRVVSVVGAGALCFLVGAFAGAWIDGALSGPDVTGSTPVARSPRHTAAHPAAAPAPSVATSAAELAALARANATPCEKVVDQVRAFRHNIGDAVCIVDHHGETLRVELKGAALHPSPAMVDTFAMATASLLRDGAAANLWPAGVDLRFAMTAVRQDGYGRPDARPDGSLRTLAVLELTFPAKERHLLDAALSPGTVFDLGHPRILEREIEPTLLDYCTGSGINAPVFCRRIDAAIDDAG